MIQNIFGPTNIWVQKVKKIGCKKILVTKIFESKAFCPTKIKGPKKLGPKSFVKMGPVTAEILLQKNGLQMFGQIWVSNS